MSRVITVRVVRMLFLQFVKYSSSFVGTPKNEIPGAALELCQFKIKPFSPEILKFSTKHEDNPFTLNYYMVPRTFLFIFHAGSHRVGSNNFRNSSCKERRSARVSRLPFRFLWLYLDLSTICWVMMCFILSVVFMFSCRNSLCYQMLPKAVIGNFLHWSSREEV